MNAVTPNEKFANQCDALMAFSFYALIYFLPISIALSETFTGLAFFAYLLKRGGVFYGLLKDKDSRVRGGNIFVSLLRNIYVAFKPVRSALNIPILIFLSVNVMSVIQSQFLLLSVEGFVGKILQSVFLYFNFIECMRSDKRVKIFMSVLMVSFTLIIMNGMYQLFSGTDFIFGNAFHGRLFSSLRHANDFAAYLIMIIPILFCMCMLPREREPGATHGKTAADLSYFSSWRTRILSVLLLVIAMVCLGLTYSRGAWIGFILSFLIFGLTNRKALILYGMIIVAFIVFFYPKLKEHRPIIHDIKSFRVENNRLSYWQRAEDIIKDYPYFGSGVNTYARVAERYSIGWGGYPHNSYLQMASDTGLIGLAAFLWMLLVLFWNALRALRRVGVQTHKMIGTGALTGLLAFLVHSFFDTNFYSVQLGSLMWVMMGFIVAVKELGRAPDAA